MYCTINKIFGWKSKELSEESIKTPSTANNRSAPKLIYIHNSKIAVRFLDNCLKQDKV